MPPTIKPALGLLLAITAAASMWFYVDRILIGYQKADAAAQDRPRGNLSDLYPRWLGARELLLHRRNPYSDEITREIQKGYYGRELDANRPHDPRDREAFAYPLYVVFLLAPVVGIPFPLLQIFFSWLLLGLAVASVWLWLRALHWRPGLPRTAAIAILVVGSYPAVQGIKLQQLSLAVAALVAGAAACVAGGCLFLAGGLLALATIKPQLAWPLAAWFLGWACGDWRTRRRLVYGFALMMIFLLGASEILLPAWWRLFADALVRYHGYTQNQSVLEVLLPGPYAGKIVNLTAVAVCGWRLWRFRRAPVESPQFAAATALVMALTVLVVPMLAPYNQVLLLPAILFTLRCRSRDAGQSRGIRFLWNAFLIAVVWPWLASVILSGIYLLGFQALALSAWSWPFFSTFAIPVTVFALVLPLMFDEMGAETEDSSAKDRSGKRQHKFFP